MPGNVPFAVTATGLAYPVQGFLNLAGDLVGLGAQIMGAGAGGSFPLRSVASGSDVFTSGSDDTLAVYALGALYDGFSVMQRAHCASSLNLGSYTGRGVALTAGPGEWTAYGDDGVGTQAQAIQPAAGAFLRNVCRSITVCTAADATPATAAIRVYLRDGAAGVGPILWVGVLRGPANSSNTITLTGLNLVGSENTEMTLEFAAAPDAGHFQTACFTGYIST